MIACFAVLASLGVAALTAGSFAPDWRMAVVANFRAQLAMAAALCVVLVGVVDLSALSRFALEVVLVVAIVVNVREIHRAIRESDGSVGGQRLRLAFANILVSNHEHSRVIEWVRAERPDIFIAAEALQAWPAALAALEVEFPHVAKCRMGDVMIFSRHSFEEPPQDLFAEIGHAAVVRIDGLTVIGVHAASPENRRRHRSLVDLVAQVGERARRAPGPVVVVGDLNATPWTAIVVKLMADAGLACGPGARVGTFPTEKGGRMWPRWLAIPIDLVLAGRGARVIDRRHGRHIGSDHWPVVAEIQYSRCLDPPDPRP